MCPSELGNNSFEPKAGIVAVLLEGYRYKKVGPDGSGRKNFKMETQCN
jgi:hypothetical protein